MEDLTLVGVHDDGEHLVLGGAEGQRFRVRLDDALRAAVRRDRARLGQIQLESDGGLRPREIQARIRAGQTAEEIADAAGIPLEHVRRYEGPVLAEREFIAAQARTVRVRRSGPGGTATLTLGELTTQRLAQREIDEQSGEWDAWRDDDGRWVVSLAFTAGSTRRCAHWRYDPQARHVQPRDDEARWLTDEEPPEAGPLTQRRLAQLREGRDGVTDRVYDVEADDGVRPGIDPRPGEVRRATVDLLETLRERRGRRQRLALPDEGQEPEPDGDDELDTAVETLRSRAEALGNPPAAHPPRSRPEQADDAEVLQLPEDEVIELPEDEEPALRRRPEPATAGPARSGARPGGRTSTAAPTPTRTTPARGTPERATPERGGAARGAAGRAATPAPPGRAPATAKTAPPRAPAAKPAAAKPAAGTPSVSRAGAGRPGAGGPGAGSAGAGRPGAGSAGAGRPGAGSAGAGRAGAGSAGAGRAGAGRAGAAQGTGPDPGGQRRATGGAAAGRDGREGREGTPEPAPGLDYDPRTEEPVERPGTPRRSRRASVPSWDDILFGSRRE